MSELFPPNFTASNSRRRVTLRIVACVALGLSFVSSAGSEDVPQELAALATKARLGGTITAWCRAEFQSGESGSFALAVTRNGRKRYVALDSHARVTELSPFKGSADLSCYSRAEAEKLDAAIRQSETIQGDITPQWNTTVVCGFTDDTAAACWQYSPDDRAFVRIGQWVT
jgi:hypothetical protein